MGETEKQFTRKNPPPADSPVWQALKLYELALEHVAVHPDTRALALREREDGGVSLVTKGGQKLSWPVPDGEPRRRLTQVEKDGQAPPVRETVWKGRNVPAEVRLAPPLEACDGTAKAVPHRSDRAATQPGGMQHQSNAPRSSATDC